MKREYTLNLLDAPPKRKTRKPRSGVAVRSSDLFCVPSGVKPVVLLSGGRTSGKMLEMLLKMYPNLRQDFLICFGNTGKEIPQTLDFLHEMETRWQLPLVWLEYTRVTAASIPAGIFPTEQRNKNLAKAAAAGEETHWFKIVNYETADRKGTPFDELNEWASVLPNQGARMCSVQLKIRTVMRYLFSLGLKEYAPIIGIRKDEEHRVTQILASADNFEHCQFPLVKWGITVRDVMTYWKGNDFDLQLESYEGNCDLCFLKKLSKRVAMARKYPDRVAWWAGWEARKQCEGNGKYFRLGEPMSLLPKLAAERELFTTPENEIDLPCSCAERGFEASDDV